ncbi:MAG TPA: DUF192 domain-containing protein [Gemmatimonadales bacterium]|nr:DUF192 domain-containing protein [Gemmatimonadales bacterium]
MRRMRAANGRGRLLGDQIGVADRWWLRLRGLLGREGLPAGEGLLLDPCKAVHMLGMRFPLDVAFLDLNGAVVAVYHDLAPGARTGWHRAAARALELPAGTLQASGTGVGDTIVCTPEASP